MCAASVTWNATLFVSVSDTERFRDLSPSPPPTLCTAMTGYWLGLVGHTQHVFLGFVLDTQMETHCFYIRAPTFTELHEKIFRPDFGKQQRQEEINAGSGPDGKVWPAPVDVRKRLHK